MHIKWLEDFITLAQTRSFSRAAELRHVTPPRIRAAHPGAGGLGRHTAGGAGWQPGAADTCW